MSDRTIPVARTAPHSPAVGMLRSFARRWEQSAQACQLVPFERFVTGRIPTITEYPFPYIAIIPGSGFGRYRTDRAEGSRRVLSFHAWLDPARLEDGEAIMEQARQIYANEAWKYDFGTVIDVLDGGPANAKQINDATYQCWELVKLFTLCLQQPRFDVSCDSTPCGEISLISGSSRESIIGSGSSLSR